MPACSCLVNAARKEQTLLSCVSVSHSNLHLSLPFASFSIVTGLIVSVSSFRDPHLWVLSTRESLLCAPASGQSCHDWWAKKKLSRLAYFTSLSLQMSRNCFSFIASKKGKNALQILKMETMLISHGEAFLAQLQNGCMSEKAIP